MQRRYSSLQVSWLTPAEIFSPHFGAALANYISHTHQNDVRFKSHPLKIYEIGGGTGTLAKDILSWLREHRPSLHDTCTYSCIEISPTLAALQHQRVAEEAGHGERFRVVQGDAAEGATWTAAGAVKNNNYSSGSEEVTQPPCFVVAMEVLDNLPHDRAVWQSNEWHETLVTHQQQQQNLNLTPGSFKEVLEPLEDPLIAQCLETWLSIPSSSSSNTLYSEDENIIVRLLRHALRSAVGEEVVFLPTGALQLFNALGRGAATQNHKLIFADFDALPETVMEGRNAPLVASTRGGTTHDYGTYLMNPGDADIFFPSDFELLSRLYATRVGREAQHMKAQSFFEQWAEGGDAGVVRRCRDGYDPLLQDYSNTAFLLS